MVFRFWHQKLCAKRIIEILKWKNELSTLQTIIFKLIFSTNSQRITQILAHKKIFTPGNAEWLMSLQSPINYSQLYKKHQNKAISQVQGKKIQYLKNTPCL